MFDPGEIRDLQWAAPEDQIVYQERALQNLVAYVSARSPYYRELFQTQKINPASIQGLQDLQNLPVTTKDDLQGRNEDFLCVSPDTIADYVTTSGTLGEPVLIASTPADLERLALNEALSFECAGAGKSDVFQLMTTLDRRFMAGLAYYLGVRHLGGSIVRVGAGVPELQWDTIFRVKPTVLIGVPSFVLNMLRYAEAEGIDHQNTSVKKVLCIGEPIRSQDLSLNSLGQQIYERWPVELYSTYASTEMATAFTECEEGRGGHHQPGLIIVELLDEHNQPVPVGEPGEVTITTLHLEAMPLIRFKTGDICRLERTPCPCGRKTMRLGPVLGRRQHMIKYKGTTLYPPALYDILDSFSDIQGYIVELSTNSLGGDEIQILAGCDNPSEKLAARMRDHFRARLRVSPAIRFGPVKEVRARLFPENSRKPVTFIDRRHE